jgi:predicted RNA-binding protein
MGFTAVPVVISRCGLDQKLSFATLHHNFALPGRPRRSKVKVIKIHLKFSKIIFKKYIISNFLNFHLKSMLYISGISDEKIMLGEETQVMLLKILL